MEFSVLQFMYVASSTVTGISQKEPVPIHLTPTILQLLKFVKIPSQSPLFQAEQPMVSQSDRIREVFQVSIYLSSPPVDSL